MVWFYYTYLTHGETKAPKASGELFITGNLSGTTGPTDMVGV